MERNIENHVVHPPRGYCFIIDGEHIEAGEQSSVTPPDIRRIVGGIPPTLPIVQVLEDGKQVQLREDQVVALERCPKLRKLPRFRRGLNRIASEIELLRKEHPDLEVGPDNSYIIIPRFKLPPGVFTQEETTLLIVLPPTYPTAPPDNFYVAAGLTLRSGGTIQNFQKNAKLHGRTWDTFSFYIEGWNAGATPRDGHNLSTFIAAVVARLQEGA